jgi:hypothetical protein
VITEDMAQRLDESLDRIFAMVRDGNLGDLKAALSRLEADLDPVVVPGVPVSEQVLAGLRRKAERNAACLKGAARGLRSAHRRIAEVRAAATGLGAYDAKGQRLEPAAAATRIIQRL